MENKTTAEPVEEGGFMLFEMESSCVPAGPTLTLTMEEKTAVDLNPRSVVPLGSEDVRS